MGIDAVETAAQRSEAISTALASRVVIATIPTKRAIMIARPTRLPRKAFRYPKAKVNSKKARGENQIQELVAKATPKGKKRKKERIAKMG